MFSTKTLAINIITITGTSMSLQGVKVETVNGEAKLRQSINSLRSSQGSMESNRKLQNEGADIHMNSRRDKSKRKNYIKSWPFETPTFRLTNYFHELLDSFACIRIINNPNFATHHGDYARDS